MLRLLNSLGGQLEKFRPLEPGKVSMYHCGPTVKEPIHIGKFRSFLVADILRRHLEYSGCEVHQVMNITDVGHLNEFEEDAIEIAAARSGLNAWELIEQEEAKFHEERRELRIRDAHEYPKAREHVETMIDFARELEQKGVCYSAGGNLYLDVSKFRDFGKLSGKPLDELTGLQQSSKTTVSPEKKHPLDIDLWRTDAIHQMRWDSPWGRGFPGWHVECAAMSRKYLGGAFDIHTGADDNIFPHHECEIAQVEVLTDKPLARYWLHSGPVTVEGKPMNRKNANLVTVRELLGSGFRGSVVRVALLSSHYRTELDMGESTFDKARAFVDTVLGFHEHLSEAVKASASVSGSATTSSPAPWIAATDTAFCSAFDNDLDYPSAMRAILDTLVRLEPEDVGDPRQALAALEGWDRVMGAL